MEIVYKVKYASLELNWLPNSIKKDLVLPQIYYVEGLNCGGAYHRIGDSNQEWGDLTYRPIIEINTNWEEEGYSSFASTLAHEYRHHWQLYKYGKHPVWPLSNKGKTYKQMIVDYFKGAWHEMDALQYELKLAPNNVNLEWKEWLQ